MGTLLSDHLGIAVVFAAKFTNLEQPDRETNPIASTEVTSASFEGTGQVGTYFYTAPEVDQGLPHVDVKVS